MYLTTYIEIEKNEDVCNSINMYIQLNVISV